MATFLKITNREIYDKLEVIEDKVTKTNGKVKLAHWIGTTALSLVIALVIALISTGVFT